MLKLWADAGFPLGNHGYSHMDLSKNGAEDFTKDVAANEATLQSLMGARDWHWFRYPYLHEGDTQEKRAAVRKYLQEHGYRVAQVTLDFEDYAWNNPYARCVAKQDTESIAWLKSSYLSTASDYISLGQKLSNQLYGRDIKYVLLLHIGAFDSVMLPGLAGFVEQAWISFCDAGGSGEGSGVPGGSECAAALWRDVAGAIDGGAAFEVPTHDAKAHGKIERHLPIVLGWPSSGQGIFAVKFKIAFQKSRTAP